MNILVTLNSNYIKPLKVMLKSLFINNPKDTFTIYLIHSSLTDAEVSDIEAFITSHQSHFRPIKIDDSVFANAPTLFHYPKEMYYRLLAYKLLPQDIDRILYLDPDILVINPIKSLYNTDIDEYLFAAAYHNMVKGINRLRFMPYKIDTYYNSGVLLMNLKRHRQEIDEEEIYKFIENTPTMLLMPDQDILNVLFAKKIKNLDEKYYNYDVRYFHYYRITSNNIWDMDYVIKNTQILHFCGRKKPWRKDYRGKFHSLYKHYEKQALYP